MKNNLKRIAIILPVIALLLVFLAVPAAADYSPETGWSEPLEVWEPFDITETNYRTGETYTYRIGEPSSVTLNGVEIEYNFRYCIRIYRDDLLSTDLVAYHNDFLSGFTVFRLSSGQIPGSNYFSDCLGGLLYVYADGNSAAVGVRQTGFVTGSDIGEMTPYMYTAEYVDFFVEDYPIPDSFLFFGQETPIAVEAWQYIPFEVYQIGGDVSPTEPIGNVWTGIMTWITSALTTVMGAFYVDGSLTLLGTLACIGVSVGLGFLLIGIIQRFLKLRG